MRAFIAIDLTPELNISMERLIGSLRKKGSDVKWVNAGGLHLTLKFLGEVADDNLEAIGDLLESIVRNHGSFSLDLKGTGTFPSGLSRNARVLWVGITEVPGLVSLQEKIESSFEKLGFPREERPFHPHLTLGRVKSSDGLGPVLNEIGINRETEFGEMTVSRIALFESRLTPRGAVYSVRREASLS